MRRVAAIILTVVLTACSNALRWTPDYHTVQTGETLYAIAMRYDIDHRRLAAWNGLGDGTFIRKGQRIYLKGPAPGGGRTAAAPPAAPLLPAPAWQWPTAGAVAETYGATPQSQSGIRIAGREGQPVYAVAGGEVVYAGGGLPTYGQLVIIKHNETWLSAYGFNTRLRIREGDGVRGGQQIADLGLTRAGKPQLHFEIRRNGQPVDPLQYLPPRP